MSDKDYFLEEYMIEQIEGNYDDLLNSFKSIVNKKQISIYADKLYRNYIHYLDVIMGLERRNLIFETKDFDKYINLYNELVEALENIVDVDRKKLLQDLRTKLSKFIYNYHHREKSKDVATTEEPELSLSRPEEDTWWDRARQSVIGDIDLTEEEKRAIDEKILFGSTVDSDYEDVYDKIDRELLSAIKRLNDQARQGFYRPLAHQIRENEKAELSKGTDKPLSALDRASILAIKREESKFVE